MAIKRNLAANFVGQAWVAGLSLAFIPTWLDRLGVEAYALIGFYAVLQGWFALLDFGMTPTMTREMARASGGAHTPESIGDLLRSVEVVCFVLAGLSVAVIWMSSSWLASEWFSPQALDRSAVADAIAVMALVVGTRLCEGIYRGALFGMERHVWYNAVNAVLATLRYGGAAVIVLWVSATVQAFFWWQAAISLLTVMVFSTATHRWLPRSKRPARLSLGALRSVASFAGGVSLTTLIGLMVTHLDKLIISRVLGLDVFGQYMLAVAVAGIFTMLVWPIATAFYPSLAVAAASGDDAAASRRYTTATQLSALLVMPVLSICVLMPVEVLKAWTGHDELAGQVGPILRLLAFGMACNSLLQIPFGLQLAHGWTGLAVKINAVAIVVLLPGIYVGAQVFGAVGAATMWAAVNVAILPVAAMLMHRRILPREMGRWISFGVLIPMGASLSAGGLVAWALPHPTSRLDALLSVSAIGVVTIVVVAVSLPEVRRFGLQLVSNLRAHRAVRRRTDTTTGVGENPRL